MSLSLAIKRSYRYLVPKSVLNPRALVRDLLPSIFAYTLGLFTGLRFTGGQGQVENISRWEIAVFAALLVAKWWAYAPASRQSTEE